MAQLQDMLPLLIPIVVIELILLIAALIHIFTHKTYRVGNRTLWVLVSFIQIIGPIAYFVFGRGDE